MGLLSTLRVKLVADIAEYADKVREARSRATELQSGLGAVGDGLERMGSNLTRVATIAAGQLVATGISRLATAVADAGREAVTSVADYERLGASLTALTAKEIYNNAVRTESIATGTARVALTRQEAESRAALAIKVQELSTDIQVGEEKLAKSIATGKLSQAEISNRQQAIDALRRKQGEASAQLGALDIKAGQVVTTYKNVSRETLSMAQAQEQATSRVKDLLSWVQKLAIESPFTRNDVAQAFKMALAYGFTTDEAKTLTQSIIDFASATGATGETMQRVTLALGQMKAKGKVTGEELRQLTEAGFGATEILSAMGVGLQDVERGTVSADKFIAAFNKNITRNFGGAAKAQAGTFSGLLSSLQDLKDVALRTVFTPLFTAFKPVLDSIVTSLQSEDAQKFFAGIGEAISKPLSAIRLFKILIEQGIAPLSALRTVITTTLGPEATKVFDDIVAAVQNAFGWLQTNWPTIEPILIGIRAAFAAIGAILAASSIYGAIVAIGGVLATISLPVVAIVAAVGLLAAAWSSNFGGIRDTLTQVWTGTLQPALEALWAWLQVNIPIAIQAVATFWETTLRPALEAVGTFIVTQVIPALSNIASWLATNIPLAIDTVVGFWNNTLIPALTAAWDWLNANLFPTLDSFAHLVGVVLTRSAEALAALWQNVLQPALVAVWRWLVTNLTPAWNGIQAAFETIMPIVKTFLDGVWKDFQRGLEIVGELLKEAKRIFDGLAQAIENFTLPPALTRHSPSPLEQTFMGVRDSLKAIHAMGMPDFGSVSMPSWATPDLAAGGAAGGREVNMTINVGAIGDGLDLADAARAIGREVSRRL